MNLLLYLLNKLPVFLLLILSATAVIIGDYFAKYWSIHQRTVFFVVALLGYVLSGIFYIPILLREQLVTSALLWIVLNTLGFIFIGVILFNESLSALGWAGVFLGILSIIILTVS